MCEILGVSRCNYYSAVRRKEHIEPDPQHDELIEWVQKVADASDFTYGVRRMKRALNSLSGWKTANESLDERSWSERQTT